MQAPNIPKYNNEDVQFLVKPVSDKILLSDTAKVTFGDMWAKRQNWALVPVEEGDVGIWTAGHIVCIGDSVQKVSLNFCFRVARLNYDRSLLNQVKEPIKL